MAASYNDLEKKILDAGKKLLEPRPYSISSLLLFLDDLNLALRRVDQDHPVSTQEALSPLKNAFVSERLFNHSNVHVRVAVALCIIEVMRITAPDAPYDDDKMKEIFGLVVSTFEHLSNKSSPSYTNSVLILETVDLAKICLVMLDLGCDALLIEMFQHFLKTLRFTTGLLCAAYVLLYFIYFLYRDHHPMRVSSHMENIMTLVLEESEDIPPGLLSPILGHLKKDDKKIPQVSRKLAEQVLINCASKVKTYLNEAVKSSGVSLDKYSNVVASICDGTLNALKQNEVVVQQDTQEVAEESTPEQTGVLKRRLNQEHSEEADSSEESDPAETEAQTHKRARVESGSMMENTTVEAEPARVPQPCSATHQLAKVKQSIVDTITSVRQFRSELETKEQSLVDTLTSVQQFRSELKKKEDTLEASLLEVDILGEKILGINKILNS
ncbi:unnamed protein product [Microthlaspi erraticum]|uniref:Uncharacterized protein n=1 Tax=Microthlaspi erraticum TaxID=1685480 RepID=A0A6D2I6Z1_9BRAS|nr:unnamed protein product [Microthlaspi erraticum]